MSRMLNYEKWNQARNIILIDLERVLKKINLLALNGDFSNEEKSKEILAKIYNEIEAQKCILTYNDHLWRYDFKK